MTDDAVIENSMNKLHLLFGPLALCRSLTLFLLCTSNIKKTNLGSHINFIQMLFIYFYLCSLPGLGLRILSYNRSTS